nr:transmembrane channel-like protein 7 [Procambarus clarkii]
MAVNTITERAATAACRNRSHLLMMGDLNHGRIDYENKTKSVIQHNINTKFGANGVAVFNLIKDLISLNLWMSLVLCMGLVMPLVMQLVVLDDPLPSTPAAWASINTTSTHQCSPITITYDNPKVVNCSSEYMTEAGDSGSQGWEKVWWVSELLLGEGSLEHSPVFLGYYPVVLLDDVYPVAVMHLLAVLTVFLMSLVAVLTRVGQWLRYNSAFLGSHTFSKMVFTSWDFSLRRLCGVQSMQHILKNEIRAAFDEDQFQRSKYSRSRTQVAFLYIKRLFVNCVIFVAMSVGYMVIIVITNYRPFLEDRIDNKYPEGTWRNVTLNSIINYLDTVTVWVVGLVLPPLLSLLGTMEEYSSRVSMLLFIFRNAAVRLSSLGVLVISHLIVASSDSTEDCRPAMPCWETALAQKLYAQIMWDFVIRVTWTVLLLTNRLLTMLFCLKISVSLPEFDAPSRVLDVLTLQTICWLSIAVSPLLPLMVLVSLFLLLLLDVVGALLVTKSPSHMFQASHSSAMFMVVLAVSWVGAATVTVAVFFFVPPSLACGPFRGLTVAWDAITNYICNLDGYFTWLR